MSVVVIGDVILDEYWKGSSRRLSPESPVAITNVDQQIYKLGGASNVAAGLKALGTDVYLLGVTGDDFGGAQVQKLLLENNIPHSISKDPNNPTIRKVRVHSGTHYMARMDFEKQFQTQTLWPQLSQGLDFNFNYLVLSDYNKGTLSNPDLILSWALKQDSVKVLVDPKKDLGAYKGAWLVKPNKEEFKKYVGDYNSHEELVSLARASLKKNSMTYMLITLGPEGMMLVNQEDKFFVPSEDVSVFDVTGAGDTVIASLAAFLNKNYDIRQAVQLATQAAAVSVSKIGTYTVTLADLDLNPGP